MGKIQLFLPKWKLIVFLSLSNTKVSRNTSLFGFDSSNRTSLYTKFSNFEIAVHANHDGLQIEQGVVFESLVHLDLMVAVTLEHFRHRLLEPLQLDLLLGLLLPFEVQVLVFFECVS